MADFTDMNSPQTTGIQEWVMEKIEGRIQLKGVLLIS